MKFKLPEPRTLKALSLGLGLAAAFQAVSVLIFPAQSDNAKKHYSMPKKVRLPESSARYAEVLGMN